MDRSASVGYLLIAVIIGVFWYINRENYKEIQQNKTKEDSVSVTSILPDSTTLNAIDSGMVESSDEEALRLNKNANQKFFYLEDDERKIAISNFGGAPENICLKKYKTHSQNDLYLFDKQEFKYNISIPTMEGPIATNQLLFTQKSANKNKLVLESKLSEEQSILIAYQLKENFILSQQVSLIGFDNIVPRKQGYLTLKMGLQQPLLEQSAKNEREASRILFKYRENESIDYITKEDKTLQGEINWISFKQKFFNTTIIAHDNFIDDGSQIKIESPENENNTDWVKKAEAEIYLSYDFNPKESYDMSFYMGPNHYQTLRKQSLNLEKMIPLGPSIISWVNKLAVIPIFNFLSSFFNSFGVIILMLTIILKLVLSPLTFKSYVSMAKMRVLKPEIDAMKEKYGDNMQKMQQEQMKLYKKAGASPFGGCLPLLIQMPILFAMFRFFPSSIELRQETLWWCKDLSTYDSILDLGFEIPFYGDHVSLFTLLMTISTLIYTRLNNSMSGATGQMKVISYIMPIMFLGFFNNYPAALSFYYFLANMITFGQNALIKRFFVDENKIKKQIEANKKKVGPVKKSRFQKKIEEMAKKRGIDPYSGRPKR